MNKIDENLKLKQLRWQCRRGMLELDLLLESFFDHHYQQLSSAQQKIFIRLLQRSDQELYNWFLKEIPPPDEELAYIIRHILSVSSEN